MWVNPTKRGQFWGTGRPFVKTTQARREPLTLWEDSMGARSKPWGDAGVPGASEWTDRVTGEDSRVKQGQGRCKKALGCRDPSTWGNWERGVGTHDNPPAPSTEGDPGLGASRCPVRDRVDSRLCPAMRDRGLHSRGPCAAAGAQGVHVTGQPFRARGASPGLRPRQPPSLTALRDSAPHPTFPCPSSTRTVLLYSSSAMHLSLEDADDMLHGEGRAAGPATEQLRGPGLWGRQWPRLDKEANGARDALCFVLFAVCTPSCWAAISRTAVPGSFPSQGKGYGTSSERSP